MQTRCVEESPSQQQLEYWQQHMQHVSSWARAAIISDGQTNSWHWFDLSICTAEYGETATADCAEETVEPLEYYAKLLNVYAVHRPEYQLFTIKPGKLKVGEDWSRLLRAHATKFLHIWLFERTLCMLNVLISTVFLAFCSFAGVFGQTSQQRASLCKTVFF